VAAFRSLGVAFAACVAIAALAAPAGAELTLTVANASERSADFAERICARDELCVRHGVMNCRRQSARVVLCRIFDERDTQIQGRYQCNRQVRVALDPKTRRRPITGLGDWNC
jgi:hypothetical protein